jgi:hypothetical protein
VYKSGLYGCGKMEEIETTPVAGKAAHHGPSELNMVTELLFNLGHFYLLPSALLSRALLIAYSNPSRQTERLPPRATAPHHRPHTHISQA